MRTPDELWSFVYRRFEGHPKNNYIGLCYIISSLFYNKIIDIEERRYLTDVIWEDIPKDEVYLFEIRDIKARKRYIKSKIMNARTKRELWFPKGIYNKICLYWDVLTFTAFLLLVLLGVMWLFATVVNWII